jgi:uncharacterized protein Yka (UPF0111/DUF47 family)
MKTRILSAIGEHGLQPAASLNAGLAANDRVKYAFSLLQVAIDHARHPEQPVASLRQERLGCGIDDPDLDNVTAGAHMVGTSCHVPCAARIFACIADDMRLMAAPVLAVRPEEFAARLDKLLGTMPSTQDDLLDPAATSAMMQAGHGVSDSLHRLVMDLHKQLNALQAAMAEEILDGAAVYNLALADRPFIAAFMNGLNRTAPLKFTHPGLTTTATRAAGRLVIQNDIGTTDAHVIVIHVQDLTVTVTYTDVHPERLAFFQEMLKPSGVTWEAQRTAVLAAGEPFYLATGTMTASDDAACRSCLDLLGSRLVFLIDWNRARKQLRQFLRGPDRQAVLLWAAEADVGHRGFLELGGARLVNQAIEATAGSSMHFGDRLCDVLGDKETLAFMHVVFQTATDGLSSGDSHALIHDRIRVALATHFSNEEQRLLHIAADHAGLVFELATLVRDGMRAGPDTAAKRIRRAGRFEHDADQLVKETRGIVRRRSDFAMFLSILEAADDAADELEDAAFLMDLNTLQGKPLEGLQALADLLAETSQEWIKALGHAGQIGRLAGQAEMEDFLTAIDRVSALEHRADDAERALTVSAVTHANDFRQLHLFTAIGGKFEAAADALKHASLMLRDHVLEDVIDG